MTTVEIYNPNTDGVINKAENEVADITTFVHTPVHVIYKNKFMSLIHQRFAALFDKIIGSPTIAVISITPVFRRATHSVICYDIWYLL